VRPATNGCIEDARFAFQHLLSNPRKEEQRKDCHHKARKGDSFQQFQLFKLSR